MVHDHVSMQRAIDTGEAIHDCVGKTIVSAEVKADAVVLTLSDNDQLWIQWCKDNETYWVWKGQGRRA